MSNSNIDQEVVNNLTTNNTYVALSAAQGKKLKDLFNYDISNYRGIGTRDEGVLIAINPTTNLLALICDNHTYYFRLTPYNP